MSWFRRDADAGETALLREALLRVLAHLGDGVDDKARARLDRLVDRLQRPPVPTGLVREVHAVVGGLPGPAAPAPGRSVETAEAVGEMTGALVDTLGASALLDQELYDAIAALEAAVPPKVGRGDARRLTSEAERVREVAGPARERALATRAMLHGGFRELKEVLQPTGSQCAAIDWGLSELAGTLASASEPEGLYAMRSELLLALRDLSGNSAALRGQLKRAQEHIRQLEAALDEADHSLEEARQAAEQDGLTGIPNRASFDRDLLAAVRRSREAGTGFCLVLLDVDHFKGVNDRHGHAAGDQVLRTLSLRLVERVRDADRVARVGGEEFGLLLHETTADDAREVVERIRGAVEAEGFTGEGGAFAVTVSLGLAAHDGEESGLELYKRADRALYEAKQAGRNRVVLAA